MVDINSQEFWEKLSQQFKEDPAKCLNYRDEIIATFPKGSPEFLAFSSRYLPFLIQEIYTTLDLPKRQAIVFRFQSCLIQQYLNAVEFIKTQGRKPRNEEEKLEWLKWLISPLLLWRKIELGGLSYPFILEEVNLEKELDLEKLHYDEERYEIEYGDDPLLGKWGVDGSTRLCFRDRTKELRDKAKEPPSEEEEEIAKERQYHLTHAIQGLRQRLQLEYAQKKTIQPGLAEALVRRERQLRDAQNWRQIRQSSLARAIVELSLDEYFYNEWLPNLTADTMRSKDLLDQICVVYAIKKAQNGDEKAIDGLFNVYKGRAEGLAFEFAKRRMPAGMDVKVRKSYIQDAKDTVLMILKNLIRGDTSQALIDWLTTPNTADSFLGVQTRKAKDIFLEYLLNYLPEELNKIRNECKEHNEIKDLASIGQETRPDLADQWDEHIKWANSQLGVEGLKITALLDPLSIINRDTLYLSPSSLRKLTKLDPDNLVKKTWGYVFNKYVFQFRKKEDNLTIWLFGQEKPRSYGKVEYRLRAYYMRKQTRQKKIEKLVGEQIEKYSDNKEDSDDVDNGHAYSYCPSNKLTSRDTEIDFEKIIEYLESQDVSGQDKRDIEIFSEYIREKMSNARSPALEVGKTYGLSKRRINQIVKGVRERFNLDKFLKEYLQN